MLRGKAPFSAVLSFVAFPNSTAEHSSPRQFHPPGKASWVRTGPIRGRVLGFSALKFFGTQVCWPHGPSQVRICLGLAHKSNEDSKGQLLILCRDLTPFGCVAAAASRPRQTVENWLSHALSSRLLSFPLFTLSLSPLSFSFPSLCPRCLVHRVSNLQAQWWKWLEHSASNGAASRAPLRAAEAGRDRNS